MSANKNLIVDLAREAVISEILTTGVVVGCWPLWKSQFDSYFGNKPTTDEILSAGSILSRVFESSKGSNGRGQSSVSGAGAAWEALVCYYLNLCLIGSPAVVFRKRSQVPAGIRDALTVNYRSVPANTESDLIAVTFPTDDPHLALPLAQKETAFERLERVVSTAFSEVSVSVVQCKTNWNENAQIPMLWDIVYNTKSFRDDKIIVGKTQNIEKLKYFRYAFATVPTNRIEIYKPTTLAVRRVHELSGGNYWGRPAKSGVARELGEIFRGACIGPDGGRGVRQSLNDALPRLASDYRYFKLS